MTTLVLAIAVLAVGTLAMKALGPLASAGRELPPRLQQLVELLPAALLAALVANQTVADGAAMTIDARVVGLGVAALAVALRAPFIVVVALGAGSTALVRALGWG
jgi:uncharacterized membrane protein